MFMISCGRIGDDTFRKQPVVVRLSRLTGCLPRSHSAKNHTDTLFIIKSIVLGESHLTLVPSTLLTKFLCLVR